MKATIFPRCQNFISLLMMSVKSSYYSITAGVLTPLALFLISGGMANIIDSSNLLRTLILGTNVLFALGIALWRPINPIVYSAALAVTCFVVPFGIGAIAGWGNLGGLAVLFATAWGLLVGGGVAVLGSLLRLLKLPEWAAPGTIGVAVAVSLVMAAWGLEKRSEQSVAIIDRVQEIRRAELVYASQRADHAFTCNGPDLPSLKNFEWRANLSLGLQEKNQAQVEGYWLYLRCPPSAHPQWVEIVTDLSTGQVVRVTR